MKSAQPKSQQIGIVAGKARFLMVKSQQSQYPVGGKTAPAVVSVLKKWRFHQSEAIGSFHKIG